MSSQKEKDSKSSSTRVFVAKYPLSWGQADIERLFSRSGKIENIFLKQYYCFIQYQKCSDALHAIKKRDGYGIEGHNLVVKQAIPESSTRRDPYYADGSSSAYRNKSHSSPPRKSKKRRHSTSNSKSRSRSESRNRLSWPIRKCFRCGKAGHIARLCTGQRSLRDNSKKVSKSRSASKKSKGSRDNDRKLKDSPKEGSAGLNRGL